MSVRCLAPRLAALVLLVVTYYGCATPVAIVPTLTLEEHILRVSLPVDPQGSVSLAAYEPLIGQIDLTPILKAEGAPPVPDGPRRFVQLMMYYGRFYVVADGFHALWEITPRPGTRTASYRPIALSSGDDRVPLKGVRLSRYGSSESSCLRIDRADADPVFITPDGGPADACR